MAPLVVMYYNYNIPLLFFQMGNVEKRPSCAPMAGSAGEEVAFPTAARNVPPVPDN